MQGKVHREGCTRKPEPTRGGHGLGNAALIARSESKEKRGLSWTFRDNLGSLSAKGGKRRTKVEGVWRSIQRVFRKGIDVTTD